MNYPNKIFNLRFKGENRFGGQSHFVITIAASSKEVAKEYVKEKIGFEAEPICLMNAVYPTIYIQNGTTPKPIQVKILSNNNSHWN